MAVNDEQAYKLKRKNLKFLWKLIIGRLDTKVDKVGGKGLSTNDYTTNEKNKLAGIATMTGASSSADGAGGLVPKPEAGDEDKCLLGDGTWGTVQSGGGTVPFSFYIQNGHLYMVYPDDATNVPTATINAAGHLILTYAN